MDFKTSFENDQKLRRSEILVETDIPSHGSGAIRK